MAAHQSVLRRAVSFVIVCLFLIIVLSLGIGNEVTDDVHGILGAEKISFPDFGQYVRMRSVPAKQLSLDTPGRRAIFVGDIHGMSQALHALLDKMSYNPDKDTLFHVGDIAAKGTHAGSLSVISYLTTHNITGIRGNHDQKIIEWRGWIEWIKELDHGKGAEWLNAVESRWQAANQDEDLDEERWIKKQKKIRKNERKWWSRVPEGWQMLSGHYKIARSISKAEYDYMRSLPLIIHLPSQHAFIAHAGLLPYDPTRSITSSHQPLAHLPDLSHLGTPSLSLDGDGYGEDVKPEPTDENMRNAQELAILNEIKQNAVPWNVLNMRNLAMDNTITRKTKKGTFWADIWNGMMPLCEGFDVNAANAKGGRLPCKPSTVIYGHTASRGLDVQRWTLGLDSGCVYGRKLSALVIDSPARHRRAVAARAASDDYDDEDVKPLDDNDDAEEDKGPKTVPFGTDGQARIYSVKCHKHKESKHKVVDTEDAEP
ncbi:Metallo-dependent phosphatase [Dentipellis sp. KUC8613]|nr:Metallo-dependent phosphatase [Dentipellis sp. KUC8613]